MKMVKSLLLGSAAGLVAVTAGQAADLPVKAKPVEYVKVCSLYGAGFYYMPGTDLCLKIGGWVRAEAGWGFGGSFATGPFAGNVDQRTTNNLIFRARGYITADAREQTAYGTARGYIAVGVSTTTVGLDTSANTFSANRAFIQFAGITAGISQSFYDYYSVPATSYNGFFPASDTGDPGWLVFGYTAQLGNGLSATLSMEGRRTTQIIDENAVNGTAPAASSAFFATPGGTITPGGYFDTLTGAESAAAAAPATVFVNGNGSLLPGNGAYGGQQVGDIVANLRLDQAWGGAQLMGALHDDNASYYSSTSTGTPTVASGGHPGDKWGWAAGAGLRLNFPMIGQGDYFQAQANYTEGALRYIFMSPNQNYGKVDDHQAQSFGILSDCVYGGLINASAPAGAGTNTGCNLTTAWGFNAAYEHHWSPAWQTSAYGGWASVRYNQQATNELCQAGGFGTSTSAIGNAAQAAAGCDMNWSTWFVGSRTQWNVSKTFYMGLDVTYEVLDGAKLPPGQTNGAGGTNPLGGFAMNNANGLESSSHDWAVRFRAHKDFLP